jgi:GNAT superfamily N-acetyltransferase
MSLEYALEKYPWKTKLRDGTDCVVRPMRRPDCSRLGRFFESVPQVEQMFIKHRTRDPGLFQTWCRAIDYETNLPLLLLHRAKVIGEATLHQRPGGWKRHIGLVTVLTHPQYRGRDVAKMLVNELIEIAQHLGLTKLEAEFNGERSVAIKALQQLGFRELCRVPDQLLDMEGITHDYVVLGMDIVTEEEFTSAF